LNKLVAVLLAVLAVAYPVLVYWGLGYFEPRYMAVLLAALACIRAVLVRQALWWWVAGGALMLSVWSFASNGLVPLKLYPVLVNALFFVLFMGSLVHPPSMIERLARLREPQLPSSAVAYTRRVTQVWCAFFVCNGALAAATAVWASEAVWALYNGLLSYAAMGFLMALEWCVRQRVRQRVL
jgi:uncharacterized membrane protein